MAAVVDKDKCTGCKVCVEVCPVEAIKVNDVAVISEECVECGRCIDECFNKAISIP
ncbi:MAG: 4Fe-4S binding protein [Candidatus Omnitrophica bacterium]|nr:4Fe-4S binding protein [Candidatus Omnitrophota bacterium]